MGELIELLIQISMKEVAVAENQDNLTPLFYPPLKAGRTLKVLINHWMKYQEQCYQLFCHENSK